MDYEFFLARVAEMVGRPEAELDCARLNKLHEREYSPEDAADVIESEGW